MNRWKFSLTMAAVLLSGAAYAHPQPKSMSPKPKSVLSTAPTEIRMIFSEGLEGAFSGLEVDDSSGKAVPAGPAALDPKSNRTLIVPLKAKLAAGAYTVKWHAVGTDTHHVEGQYGFTVK